MITLIERARFRSDAEAVIWCWFFSDECVCVSLGAVIKKTAGNG